MGRPPITDWNSAPLGVVDDAELAGRLGCSPETVRRHRERRGILPVGYYPGLCRVDWDAVRWEDGETNAAIGRRLGMPTARWLGHRGIDWDSQPLGEQTDEEIGRRLGVDHSAVAAARRVRGVSRFPSREVDWDRVDDLGLTWDTVIAAREGVGLGAVAAARRRRGVSRYRPARRVCACGRSFCPTRRSHAYCSLACWSAAVDGRQRIGIEDATALRAHVALVALRREVAARRGGRNS